MITFIVSGCMTDVKVKVQKILKDVLTNEFSGNLQDIDSVEFVDLMLTLEKEFDIIIDEDGFSEVGSQDDIVRLVSNKI